MIPRFNYAYSLGDAWNSLKGLTSGNKQHTDHFSELFPDAETYLIGSARVGIKLALQAFGLKPGARVGCQPYTCSSVLAAIVAAGYKPLFIDINEQLTLDDDDLRRKLPQLDALIVTHTFGLPANIRQIKQLVGTLPVLEDCAHAFISRYEGTQLGNFFDAAVFSFGNGKFPSFGSGGLLVINNRTYLAPVSAMLRDLKPPTLFQELTFIGKRLINAGIHSPIGSRLIYALLNKKFVSNRNRQALAYPPHERLLYRSIDYSIQKQVSQVKKRALTQQENARYLIERHNGRYKMLIQHQDTGNSFAVVLLSEERDNLYDFLQTNGIGAGKHFQHAQSWAMQFGYKPGECPTFDNVAGHVLTIPCHYSLTQRDLQNIDQCLNVYAQTNATVNEASFNRH